jgi:hypothetical protein
MAANKSACARGATLLPAINNRLFCAASICDGCARANTCVDLFQLISNNTHPSSHQNKVSICHTLADVCGTFAYGTEFFSGR